MAQDADSPKGRSEAHSLRLAVTIVNFRTPTLVVGCLESLESQLDPSLDCAVVVDNASGDGSVAQIEEAIRERGWGDRVKLVCSPENGGFSAGHNLGMQAVKASVYVLLNSDAIALPGAMAELLKAAALRPEAGIIGPRLEHANGETQCSVFRNVTPIGEFLAAADTGPLSRMLKRYDVIRPTSEVASEVDWASFACVLIRSEVAAQIGAMDARYFMYFEDVDYCRRARAAGWTVWYWPAARVVHLQGASSDVHVARHTRERPPAFYYRSRSRYFAKFYGAGGLWLANCLWHAGRAIAVVRERIGGKPKTACANEWRDIWRSASRPLAPASSDS